MLSSLKRIYSVINQAAWAFEKDYEPEYLLRNAETPAYCFKPGHHHHDAFVKELGTAFVSKYSRPLILAPSGWLITPKRKIIASSVPFACTDHNLKPMPSIWRYLFGRSTVTIGEAVSVVYGWDNYYHFFIDTLPQFYLMEELNIPSKVPVIVPEGVLQLPYVQAFDQMTGLLSKRRLIEQETNQYYKITQTTFVLKGSRFNAKPFTSIRSLLDALPGEQETHSAEKIFVTRHGKRSLANFKAIKAIALKYGFTVIDPGNHSFEQQVAIFRNARLIIGLHGAGLTNMLFSKHAVSVMEILPDDAPHRYFHYRHLAGALGYEYMDCVGTALMPDGLYTMDVSVFEERIAELADTQRKHSSAS